MGGLGQCGCVISVAMYSSVSPGAIARLQGRSRRFGGGGWPQRLWVTIGG
jgi:hypothetical protein